MLVKYKKSCKKIAMGLLSLMPQEKKLQTLLQTIQMYEENPDWQLYLWKQEEDFVGVAGIETAGNRFIVHHLSVNPSHQSEGIGQSMIEKLQQMMQNREMAATEETAAFLEKCSCDKAVSI